MTEERAKELVDGIVEFVDYGGIPVEEVIAALKYELLTPDGKLIPDNCSMLRNQGPITFTFKTVQDLDDKYNAIGVKYKNTAIEFTRISL